MATNSIMGSLSGLVSGKDGMPTHAAQRAAQLPTLEDAQAQRFQGISDQFKEGGLTPLTAVLKGVTGQVAASKSEKAQAQRDAKQRAVNEMIQWEQNEAKHRAEVEQMLRSEMEMRVTGTQLSQGIDQAAVGDDSGIRNWFASNPETAKMMSGRLGVPVESATVSNINGVDVLIPFGRDADGNLMTGEAMPVDSVLKAYAPDAYAARYANRQAEAVAQRDLALTDARIETEEAQAENYRAQAESRANPSAKPLPVAALRMQDDALQAIGTINQTNANIDQMIANIDSGALKTDWLNRTVSKAVNATDNSTPQSRALASYDANIKKMINDSLLLAKGVQTEGDAQRAADAIMAAPYDTAAVRERLNELKAINARSAELRKLANDQVRANFGHEPLDYGAYESQQPSRTEPQAGQYREGQTATNPQTGQTITYRNGQWQ